MNLITGGGSCSLISKSERTQSGNRRPKGHYEKAKENAGNIDPQIKLAVRPAKEAAAPSSARYATVSSILDTRDLQGRTLHGILLESDPDSPESCVDHAHRFARAAIRLQKTLVAQSASLS
jgi:hypothetical protein